MEYEGEIKGVIAKWWGNRARTYDYSPGHGIHSDEEKKAWLEILSSALGHKTGLRILDVGTGTGALALLLAEMNHKVFGIDLSEQMLQKARVKAGSANLNITFRVGDAEAPPFENESFDAIVNRHLVWTLPNPEQAVRAWQNILKPGGRLVIVDGNFGRDEKTVFQKIWRYMAMPLVLITEQRIPSMPNKVLDAHLPMRNRDRPAADIEILKGLGFKTDVTNVSLPRKYTFLSYMKYGHSQYSDQQFVVKGIKAA